MTSRDRSRSHAFGPSTEIASESNSCSGRELGEDRGRRRRRRGAEVAVAQFGGAGEEEVAPGAVLGAVAELFERVGVQRAGRGVRLVGEHGVVQQRRGPAVVALVERRLGELDDAVDAADGRRRSGWRARPAGAATAGPGCRRTSPCSAGRSP